MTISQATIKMSRPTFTIQNQPVRAGGALFYTCVNNVFYALVSCKEGVFEDLGGKTDVGDTTIYDTVAREVFEETNGVFKQTPVKRQLEKSSWLYNPKSKYILFLVEANVFEVNCSESRFGTQETGKKERIISWIPVHTLLQSPLHHRLQLQKNFIQEFFGL